MKRPIEQQAAFYRGYATRDRDLAPLTILWATIIASWFLVYAIGCLVPVTKPKAEVATQRSSFVAQP
ncbi:MAG TPA: hypothetical protein VLI91_12630 [Roseiarcus sp.]|nr:hypothetical protein [Roseiarcus sp.]